MPQRTYTLWPRDPMLARDGRPFTTDPGALAESLPWPLPSTLAGALRAHVGGWRGYREWSPDQVEAIKHVAVAGPLMAASTEGADWRIYVSAPCDAVLFGKPEALEVMRLRPMAQLPDGAGCDLADGLLPLAVDREEKPAKGHDYWSLDDTVAWLGGNTQVPASALQRLPTETRIHVKIDPLKNASEEGKLFGTVSLCFNDVAVNAGRWDRQRQAHPRLLMLCRVAADELPADRLPAFLPVAGERRVSILEEASAIAWPALPTALSSAITGTTCLKLQLATPAIFAHGWLPGWLDAKSFTGSPPALPGVTLRLVSAVVGRREAVSGWDLAAREPKPARFMAPAGSVYFFEVQSGMIDEQALDALWLSSASDNAQDRRDGFGLTLPGVWEYAS